MIKKVQTKAKGWKIHTQLMVLILLTGLASILLFEVLWLNKWDIYEYVQQVPGLRDMSQDEEFWEKLRTEAANYNIPSSEGVYSIYLALSPLDAPPLQYTPFFDILSWLLSAPLFAMAILRPL